MLQIQSSTTRKNHTFCFIFSSSTWCSHKFIRKFEKFNDNHLENIKVYLLTWREFIMLDRSKFFIVYVHSITHLNFDFIFCIKSSRIENCLSNRMIHNFLHRELENFQAFLNSLLNFEHFLFFFWSFRCCFRIFCSIFFICRFFFFNICFIRSNRRMKKVCKISICASNRLFNFHRKVWISMFMKFKVICCSCFSSRVKIVESRNIVNFVNDRKRIERLTTFDSKSRVICFDNDR